MITVYTDGSSYTVDKSGGWGWWVTDDFCDSGFVQPATNNQMEMLAVYRGLQAVSHHGQPITVVSDSAYVINCFKQRWYEGWRRRSRASHQTGEITWRTSQDERVANQREWEILLALVETYPQPITWVHCRGHKRGGPEDEPYIFGNDKADKLAGAARKGGLAAQKENA